MTVFRDFWRGLLVIYTNTLRLIAHRPRPDLALIARLEIELGYRERPSRLIGTGLGFTIAGDFTLRDCTAQTGSTVFEGAVSHWTDDVHGGFLVPDKERGKIIP